MRVDHHHALGQVLQAAREAGIGLLGGLNNAVLRGAQLLRVLVQHGFQFFAAALAQCGQPLALAYVEHQQRCSQPQAACGNGGPVAGGLVVAYVVQQVQLPAAFWQVHAQPEHGVGQLGLAEGGQYAIAFSGLVDAVAQWLQRLVSVLVRVLYFLLVFGCKRLQQTVAPFIAVGQEDHAMLIGGQHDVWRLAPFALQLLEQNFDSYEAKHRAVIRTNGLRQKVAGQAGRHADAVKAAAAMAERLCDVGAKAVVLAHIGVRVAPVAGGQCPAPLVDEGEGGGAAGAVGLLQLAVELVHLRRA